MLLDIGAGIGELAEKIPPEKYQGIPKGHRDGKARHEKIGISHKRLHHAQAIAKHPEIVEKVKAQARENEDIPTRTAVISEIKYQKEKERQKEGDKNRKDSRSLIAIEQVQYINALDRCITILPQKPTYKRGASPGAWQTQYNLKSQSTLRSPLR
ncbi:MAG: hypothetical protein KG012_09415 [Deltaproteobacteria bacterium]|nr:hypothetical protein [Deltaproteobacteria bacterium]